MHSKPNFLIVGAAKCGTTSLARYLIQHPKVFFPDIKEPRYFVRNTLLRNAKKDPHNKEILRTSVLDKDQYFKLFETNISYKLYGEASVHYLYNFHESIRLIQENLGDIPILIIIRNPLDRAISNWAYNGADTRDFKKAIIEEEELIKKNFNSFWYYKSQSLYYNQIEAFFQSFNKVKVIIFEKFINNLELTMNEICDFLTIQNYKFDFTETHNITDCIIPKSKYLYYLYKFKYFRRLIINSRNILYNNPHHSYPFINKKELINDNDLGYYKMFFKNDIIKLENLLNCDLSIWK